MSPFRSIALALLAALSAAAPASAAFPDDADRWTVRSLTGTYSVETNASAILGQLVTTAGPYTESGTWRAVAGTVTAIRSDEDLPADDMLAGFAALAGDLPVARIDVDVSGPANALFPGHTEHVQGNTCPENASPFDWGEERGRIVFLVYRTDKGLSFVASPYNEFTKPGQTVQMQVLDQTFPYECPAVYSAMGGSDLAAGGKLVGNSQAAPDFIGQMLNGSILPGSTVTTIEEGSIRVGADVARLVSEGRSRGEVKIDSDVGPVAGTSDQTWDLELELVRERRKPVAGLPAACTGALTSVTDAGARLRSTAGAVRQAAAGSILDPGDRLSANGARVGFSAGRVEGRVGTDGVVTFFPGRDCSRFKLGWGELGLTVPAGARAAVSAANARVATSRVPATFKVVSRRVGGRRITEVNVTRGAVTVRSAGRTVTARPGRPVEIIGRGAPR